MSSAHLSATLRQTSLFSDLSDGELHALEQLAVTRRYRAGDELFTEGDDCAGMYVIGSGSVRIFKVAPSGREQVLSIEGAGDIVAEVPIFDGGPYPASARAMLDVEALFFGARELRQLCLTHSTIALKFLKFVGRRLRRLVMLVEELSFTTVRQRLIGYLLRHAQHHRSGNVAEFTLSESHQDMASHIGTVRELVSRNLSRLCAEGLIRIEGKRCIIPNLEALLEQHEGEQ
jgi:CRP/FNR family transcriptional regulator